MKTIEKPRVGGIGNDHEDGKLRHCYINDSLTALCGHKRRPGPGLPDWVPKCKTCVMLNGSGFNPN